jgi:hypothetical protein
LPHNALTILLLAFFSPAVGRKSAKIFPTRFASYPDRRLWQKKKARQLAFSPYPQQKRSIKKQNQEAMFRNETRSSGHSFFVRSARIIISPGTLHRQTIPLRDDRLRQQRGASNLLQRSTE